MPIIVWGSRGVNSTVDRGEFHCPQCDAREEYTLKQVRPFFTLFFIPIFPIGSAQRYVECRGCGGTFREEVLTYETPNETVRLLSQIYSELKTGTSLEVLKQKLVNNNFGSEEAEETLNKMCDGQPRRCACGQHFHPEVTRCTHCGDEL